MFHFHRRKKEVHQHGLTSANTAPKIEPLHVLWFGKPPFAAPVFQLGFELVEKPGDISLSSVGLYQPRLEFLMIPVQQVTHGQNGRSASRVRKIPRSDG